MRKLPSLNAVRAFEAAARSGSFVRAAQELNVTPAAVSRMVRLLEDRLGVSLFERQANRLIVTPAGRFYQTGLTQLFDTLAGLTSQVASMATSRILTVGVGPTFAVRWLIPRLADFQKIEPDIEVRFATGGAAAPFSEDWTCGIRLGNGEWPGWICEQLFAADLTPVCAPALAKRLKKPEDLKPAMLLSVAHAVDDWPRWFKAARAPRVPAKGPVLEYYGQSLQAAAAGLGVAMGIRPYIDDDLRDGRLVAPFVISIPKGDKWYLTYREARIKEPAFAAFRRWIVAAARQSTP